MPVNMTMQVDNESVKQIANALEQIKDSVGRTVLQRAARKSLKPVIKTARQLVPRETGLLRKSLGTVQKRYGRTGTLYSIVGPRTGFIGKGTDGRKRNPVNYAHLVEKGTQPHRIRGGWHPGARPRPFMRPAYDQNKSGVVKSMEDEVKLGVVKAAAKEASKAKA